MPNPPQPNTLEAYHAHLEQLPRKYRIEDKPVPIRRRIWRWLMSQIGY